MKPTYKAASVLSVLVPLCCIAWLPEAQAFRGRGAAFVVGAAVGSSNNNYPPPQQVVVQQQPATPPPAPAQQPAPAPSQQPAPTQQPVPAQLPAAQPPAGAAGPVPLGAVVPTLPPGCTQTAQGGIAYYNCGGTFYQAVFEGSTLKYITTSPK